jgi:hypothetical protein
VTSSNDVSRPFVVRELKSDHNYFRIDHEDTSGRRRLVLRSICFLTFIFAQETSSEFYATPNIGAKISSNHGSVEKWIIDD